VPECACHGLVAMCAAPETAMCALQTRAKEGGKLLSLLKDKRSHVWRFVRGPLPQTDLPRRRLDLPWKLLDVVT
jgi:hypothetical protein